MLQDREAWAARHIEARRPVVEGRFGPMRMPSLRGEREGEGDGERSGKEEGEVMKGSASGSGEEGVPRGESEQDVHGEERGVWGEERDEESGEDVDMEG